MTNKDERRLMLIEAARDVVLRYGYRKATLEDVAAEAGVSRATIYNYFPNKEKIFHEIIAHEIERLSEAMQAAVDPADPPEERLRALVRARYTHLREIKRLYAVVMNVARDVMPMAQAEFAAFQQQEVAALTALVQEGIDAGRFRFVEAPVLAQALLAALRGLDEAFVFEDQEAIAHGAEVLLDTFFLGLLQPETDR